MTRYPIIDKRRKPNYMPLLSIICAIALIMTVVISTEAHQASIESQVLVWTEEIGERYGICPELLQAMVEVESGYDVDAESSAGAVGLMQIIPRYHAERMERLGVTNIWDPYSNILVGADYLRELSADYEVAEALWVYNHGNISGFDWTDTYVQKVLTRSEELERDHGK